MSETSTTQTPAKPRILIADDSRIVRATIIKHIERKFEFREALDGEQAWETLLIDPNIRVVITDLTMPKLDGYGLLQRIRKSRISRIRNLPVVVVSGSDEQEERVRAKAAGANDLITKGIGTAQLLSRLDILANLSSAQPAYERRADGLAHNPDTGPEFATTPVEAFDQQARILLESAIRQRKNFVILNIRVHAKASANCDTNALPPFTVLSAIGQLLKSTIRQTDIVARTGETEFTLATGSIQPDSARDFAERICAAIASVKMQKGEGLTLVANCGLATLAEVRADATDLASATGALLSIASRRAVLGMQRGVSCAVGPEGELGMPPSGAQSNPTPIPEDGVLGSRSSAPALTTLLQWISDGKQDLVLPHLSKLSEELQPAFDFIQQHTQH